MPLVSDHPRDVVLSFRVSEKEKAKVLAAIPPGLSVTDFLRHATLLKADLYLERQRKRL